MDTLITYDITEDRLHESLNTKVKDAMKVLGYSESINHTDPDTKVKTKYWLPNTTLWKSDTTPEEAKADLLSVAKKSGATVERLIALEFTDNGSDNPQTL